MSCSVRKSQGGFALIYAIVGLVFVSTLFYFLSDYLIMLGKQTNRKVNLTHGRMVIHSFLDYTIYGVKQRWCFDDYWLPASNCQITHARSIERLIMSPDSTRLYNEMVAAGQIVGAPLQNLVSFTTVVDLQGMLPAHPLYQIIQTARVQVPITKVEVTLARDRRPQMPVGGREMFLRLSLRVLDTNDNVVQWQGLPMTGKVDLVVFPRELGSFAMMAANDLRLDLGYQDPVTDGDLVIHQFATRSETAGWPGLVFESPVFVNGNVVLPTSPPESNPLDPHFAAVTFSDKVFLGSGQIMRNDRRFKPKAAGDQKDQLWSQVREFGGFQRGVEIDGARDQGLDVLSSRRAIDPLDESFMERCVGLVTVRSRLNYSRNSHLAAVNKGGDLGSGFNYRLGFSGGNWITPQEGTPRGGSPVGRFRMRWRNPSVSRSYDLPAAGNPNEEYLSPGQSLAQDYSPDRSPEIPVRENERTARQQQLAQLLAAVPVDAAAVAAAQADITRLTARIDFLDEVDRRQSRVTLEVLSSPATNEQARMFVDLRVRANPANGFVNSEGEPISFQVSTELFDVGCDRGRCRGERLRGRDRDESMEASQFLQRGWLNFSAIGPAVVGPSGIALAEFGPAVYSDIADETADWVGLENACTYSPRLAFGGADWGSSFLDSTFKSWNFSPDDALLSSQANYRTGPSLFLNSGNSTPGINIRFNVKSLVNRCVIQASARFVTGFFNCRELIIEERSTPLRIIGTFILSRLNIHPTAYRYGIRWSTIYHPMATQELIQAQVLRPHVTTDNCNNPLASPIWHPYPSIREIANNFKCNIISLRNQADPFTWTTVEPDCGLLSNSDRRVPSDASNTKCKNRIVRAVVFEVSRDSSL